MDNQDLSGTDRLVEGKFVKRSNRFLAVVDVNGQIVKAHVPNSGRMGELLIRGAPVILEYAAKENRKTDYDLSKTFYNQGWVSIDSRLPNLLFSEAVKQSRIKEFIDYYFLRQEVTYGDSRRDILLEDKKSKAQYFIELKSVTLVENGVARFPDAPTKRGTRHLLTLKSLVKEGKKAGVVFIIQRGDAVSFRANNETDPLFAETLAEVHKAGVEVYAYRCDVQKDDIHLSKRIEVTL